VTNAEAEEASSEAAVRYLEEKFSTGHRSATGPAIARKMIEILPDDRNGARWWERDWRSMRWQPGKDRVL
jgi:hypothetical protein